MSPRTAGCLNSFTRIPRPSEGAACQSASKSGDRAPMGNAHERFPRMLPIVRSNNAVVPGAISDLFYQQAKRHNGMSTTLPANHWFQSRLFCKRLSLLHLLAAMLNVI